MSLTEYRKIVEHHKVTAPLHGTARIHDTFEWLPHGTIMFEQSDLFPVDIKDLHLLDLFQKDTIGETELCTDVASNPLYHIYTTVLLPTIPTQLRKYIHSCTRL